MALHEDTKHGLKSFQKGKSGQIGVRKQEDEYGYKEHYRNLNSNTMDGAARVRRAQFQVWEYEHEENHQHEDSSEFRDGI